MKTDNIEFFISLNKVGFSDGYIVCDDIKIFDDDICLFVGKFCVSCFSLKDFDLIYKFTHESHVVAFSFDLVRR